MRDKRVGGSDKHLLIAEKWAELDPRKELMRPLTLEREGQY